jgi:Phosphodiester glycosidase
VSSAPTAQRPPRVAVNRSPRRRRPLARRYPARVYWFRRVFLAVSIALFVVVSYLGITLIQALGNPSYGVSLMARAAEWGRMHGMSAVVGWVETEYYKLHPPKVGGKPPAGAFANGATGTGTTGTSTTAKGETFLPAPTRMTSPAGAWLPGEGVWHPAGRRTAAGVPAVYETFVRPDAIHTSYVVGVAWMDPKLLSAQLYSGSFIPGGGPYKYSAPITAKSSESLVAAFNAGFRMQDAQGGYYTQGKTILPLRTGGASVVIYKDGTMTVGAWNRDVSMTPQVASVRQNLVLIVKNGKAVTGLDNAHFLHWGYTLGGAYNVWRSGLGVTKDGALVYVGGPSLSIADLANVLVHAGAVRGMELDINTDWVQYSTYQGPLGRPLNGANGTDLLSSMNGAPTRFFATWWNRDFFTMSLRPSDLVVSHSKG